MLTNFDIEKYEKKINLPKFRGVFCKDKLPHNKQQNECFIINMEDSNAGDGSHWVALYKSKKDKNIYFDSSLNHSRAITNHGNAFPNRK